MRFRCPTCGHAQDTKPPVGIALGELEGAVVGTLDEGADADAPVRGGRSVGLEGLLGGERSLAEIVAAASVAGVHLPDELTPARRVRVRRSLLGAGGAERAADIGGPRHDDEPPSIVEDERPRNESDDEVPTSVDPTQSNRSGPTAVGPASRYVIRQGSRTYIVGDVGTLKRWIVEDRVGRRDEVSRDGGPWQRADAFAELAETFELAQPADARSAPLFAPVAPSYGSLRPQPAEPPLVEDLQAMRRGLSIETDPGSSPSDAGPVTDVERWTSPRFDTGPGSGPRTSVGEVTHSLAIDPVPLVDRTYRPVRGERVQVLDQRPPREDAYSVPAHREPDLPAPSASSVKPHARDDGPLGFLVGFFAMVMLGFGALWGLGLLDPMEVRDQLVSLVRPPPPAPAASVPITVVEQPAATPTPRRVAARTPTPPPPPPTPTPTPALAPVEDQEPPRVKVYDHRSSQRKSSEGDE